MSFHAAPAAEGDLTPPGAAATRVVVRAPAKINLYLRVGPLRPDGFHDLTTVYQAIGLRDELIATVAPGGAASALVIEGEGAGELPVDERNLAVRAVAALAASEHAAPRERLVLRLRKRIPIAAGLAGGSADAAAALVACDALWRTGHSVAELAAIAATLGSDVPFSLYGGVALGTGRGEIVDPLPVAPTTWHWTVAAAAGGLSTPEVYSELDRLRRLGLADPPAPPGVPSSLLAALESGDPERLGASLYNEMEPAALSLRPSLRATLEAGLAAGAIAGIVSGSGPTCVFLAESASAAATVAAKLAATDTCRWALAAAGPVPGAANSFDAPPGTGSEI